MGFLKKIMGQVGLDGSGFEAGAKRVESVAHKLSEETFGELKNGLAEAFGVAAIEEAVRRTVEWGASLSDVSKRLGITAEKLQELSYAATSTGGSQEAMISFMERLAAAREKAMTSEGGGERQSFSQLGISTADLATKTRDQLMEQISQAFKTGTAEQLIGPLREIGGRGAGALVAAFKAGIEEKGKEAREAGKVVSNATVAGFKETEERLTQFGMQLRSELAPAILWVIQKVQDWILSFKMASAVLGVLSTGNFNRAAIKVALKQVVDDDEKQRAAFAKSQAPEPESAPSAGVKKSDDYASAFAAVQKAEMETAKIQQDNILKTMPEEAKRVWYRERLLAIQKEIAKLENQPALTPDEMKRKASLEREGATLEGQLAIKPNLKLPGSDSLSKIGGFVGGAENTLISVAREQLAELRKLVKNTDFKNGTGGDSGGGIDEI